MRQLDKVIVDNRLREDVRHLNHEKPIAFYRMSLRSSNLDKIPWHWHPAIQLTSVAEGGLTYHVGNECISLRTGDGVLINVNHLHRYEPEADEEGKTQNIHFLPEFIAPTGSITYQKYVEPFILDESRPCLIFRHDIAWQKEILQLFESAAELEAAEEHPLAYEMIIHEQISVMWRQILAHMDEFETGPVLRGKIESQIRIKRMMAFIDAHYREAVYLEDIAAAAAISKREALRCFRKNVDKTPIEWLTEYRLERAKNELLVSDGTVSEVALSCGFESASYFNRVFRRYTGMTPLKYRKQMEQRNERE